MTVSDLVELLSAAWNVGIVVTDADLDTGPHILAANAAFCRLTGYRLEELRGQTPRLLHGQRTSPLARRTLLRNLRAGRRHLGEVVNYRKTGELYFCQLDIRPVRSAEGRVENFIAFEREVRRQRGRPAAGESRFQPVHTDEGLDLPFDAVLPPFAVNRE